MLRADSRLYLDVTLTLDGEGGYSLFSEVYVIESGARAEIGDDTGLGMVIHMDAAESYVKNADGTCTTSVPEHAVFEVQTDTYSGQMKGAVGLSVDGSSEDGTYDSDNVPSVLDFVPETIWTLGDGTIESWARAGADAASGADDGSAAGSGTESVSNAAGTEGESASNAAAGTEGESASGSEGSEAAEGLVITSDDGATTFTFYADGTYLFAFEAYGIEDAGSYSYDGETLTITDANGAGTEVTGDPFKLHYVSSVSDQLTGDFTIAAAELVQ